MSLREQLADKLKKDWQSELCDLPRSEWLAMADECIRQMNWAREHCMDHELRLPLTIAPEGWEDRGDR